MKLYIYRVNDHEYGVTTSLIAADKRGKIVEQWPLNTMADAAFLAQHGTSFYGASDTVTKLCELFMAVMRLDPDFVKADDPPIVKIDTLPERKTGLFARLYYAFKNTHSRVS